MRAKSPSSTGSKSRKADKWPPAADPQLAFAWEEKQRGAPNALARSALFACTDKRKPRRTFEREEIVSLGGQTVRYTGKELRQDDLSLWMQIVHLARSQHISEPVEVSANQLCTALGWGNGGRSYTRLRESIARMKEGTVWVEFPDLRGYSGNFIMRLEWSDAGSNTKEKWKIFLDPNVLKLFGFDAYTILLGEERLALTPLAQWLYLFYRTHARPFTMKVSTLYGLCGSTSATVNGFQRNLLTALDSLKERKLILDYEFSPHTKSVSVTHSPRASAALPM